MQSLATGEGWTDDAVARALAATRVIAALAIRPSRQREGAEPPAPPVPEGRLAVIARPRAGRVRAAVSSAVTAADVAVTGSRLDDAASMTHRHQLEGLQSALAELTAALYRQAPAREAATLNEAVRHARERGGRPAARTQRLENVVVAALTAVAQSVAAEWAVFDFGGLQFWRRDTGRLALLAVVGRGGRAAADPVGR